MQATDEVHSWFGPSLLDTDLEPTDHALPELTDPPVARQIRLAFFAQAVPDCPVNRIFLRMARVDPDGTAVRRNALDGEDAKAVRL